MTLVNKDKKIRKDSTNMEILLIVFSKKIRKEKKRHKETKTSL